MKLVSSLFCSLTLLSLNLVGLTKVQAQTSGFQFSNTSLILLGNGCPSGTAEAVLRGDTLSVTFPTLRAIATSPEFVSESCNLRMGLDIPAGYRVRPISINYYGYASVPRGGSGELNVTILFQGKEVPTSDDQNVNFPSGFSNTWFKNVTTTPDAIDACNGAVSSVFGINTNLIARARDVAAGQQTRIRIDDGYRIKFAFTRC